MPISRRRMPFLPLRPEFLQNPAPSPGPPNGRTGPNLKRHFGRHGHPGGPGPGRSASALTAGSSLLADALVIAGAEACRVGEMARTG